MRLKTPAQPLVFCFSGVSGLCGALAALYGACPGLAASLCVYRGAYYLAAYAPLLKRKRVFLAAGRHGAFLGPARVLYSYYAEHGCELTQNAVQDLGALLQ